MAPKLIFDAYGRELDEQGKVIPMAAVNFSTLKVNQKKAGLAGAASGVSGIRVLLNFLNSILKF